MKLSALCEDLREKRLLGGDTEILSLCTDSRIAGKGDLFFCFRGTHEDAHDYAAEAWRRGAAAIVCERELEVGCPQVIVPNGRRAMALISSAFYDHPQRRLQIIGVTGTNGKTTTVQMIEAILSECGRKVGIIGTLGARYAQKTIAPDLTTPDPVYLFSLLADMVAGGVDTVAMEVSAHALALEKECPLVYDVGIFTNLTQDHLDFFGDMTAYGEAKRTMFSPKRCRFAVLNADDPFSDSLVCGEEYQKYGLENPADCFALVESETVRGSRAMFNLNDELVEVQIKLTGRHNIYNALAAACACRRLGASGEQIARGIANCERVEGRLEFVSSFRGGSIFVDFAHTPDGLKKSLSALKEHTTGRLILLFGCGGNRDQGKRPLMGEVAAKLCDFAVITSDNPRYEDPCEIIAQIEKGYAALSKNYVAIEDREKATLYALGQLSSGDVLLVAGKGGETTQEIMGIKYSYNDKAVIKNAIGKLT